LVRQRSEWKSSGVTTTHRAVALAGRTGGGVDTHTGGGMETRFQADIADLVHPSALQARRR